MGLGIRGLMLGTCDPTWQTPAATVRGVAVLERFPPVAAGSRVVAWTQAAAPTWPTSASSLAAAVTGQGCSAAGFSKIPGQGLNLQGQGGGSPYAYVQAAVRKQNQVEDTQSTHTHTHTLSKSHTRADTHTGTQAHVCTPYNTRSNKCTCTPAHPCTWRTHTHARHNLEQALFSASH